MLTSHRTEDGFSFVEVVISMGLVVIGVMASLAVHSYVTKSTAALDAKARMVQMRNLVALTLGQKKVIAGGGLLESCSSSLVAKSGLALAVPTVGGEPISSITETSDVQLQIRIDGANVVTSGKPATGDRSTYKVALVGERKTRNPNTNEVTYVGSVNLETTIPGSEVPIKASVPLQFDVSAAGALTKCAVRVSERQISQGRFSTAECQLAGGVPVPTDLGNFCRFPFITILPPTPICPDGFVGNPVRIGTSGGCSVDYSISNSQAMLVIPTCPPPSMVEPSPTNTQGNLYCYTQGSTPVPPSPTPVPSNAPPCPIDPDWHQEDHPGASPTPVWTQYAYDSTLNRRKCRYDATCPTNMTPSTVPVSNGGDGVTPACYFQPTACPSPYLRVNFPPYPLICYTDPNQPQPLPVMSCPGGFTEVTDPVILQGWSDSRHKLCF